MPSLSDVMRAEVSSQFLISSLLSFKLDYKKKGESADGRTSERTNGRTALSVIFLPHPKAIPFHLINIMCFSESVMVVRARLISGHVRALALFSLSSRKAIIIIG